uniref:Uncharacterized protein n=1 Tax=Alcanivorax borkumensis (strain ATCC 700651 / DSM 11573 / NCIMB 13689 / SK2) TaxID=393595 RepID=Q0VLQ0_ALCBS|nr:hypothetical protein ABO_2451 [Alcanivorax borkumensis SK2]
MLICHTPRPTTQQVHLSNTQQHAIEEIQQDRSRHLIIQNARLLAFS